MNREWNDTQPIYRQLRDRGVHMILDGVLNEGDPLPSVRNVAAEFRVNPLTVLKAYQQLVDEDLGSTTQIVLTAHRRLPHKLLHSGPWPAAAFLESGTRHTARSIA